jgi:hypothetical protein
MSNGELMRPSLLEAWPVTAVPLYGDVAIWPVIGVSLPFLFLYKWFLKDHFYLFSPRCCS